LPGSEVEGVVAFFALVHEAAVVDDQGEASAAPAGFVDGQDRGVLRRSRGEGGVGDGRDHGAGLVDEADVEAGGVCEALVLDGNGDVDDVFVAVIQAVVGETGLEVGPPVGAGVELASGTEVVPEVPGVGGRDR
jgi:hypothetical protein